LRNILLSITFLFCALLFSPRTAFATTAEELHNALETQIKLCCTKSLSSRVDNTPGNNMQNWLGIIYNKAQIQPIWISTNGPGEKAEILISIIKSSGSDGLAPELYQVSRINSLWNNRTPEELAELDTLLTLAFITYAHDVQYGRTHSKENIPDPATKPEGNLAFNALALTQTALSSPDFKQFLANLLPPHKYYRYLRAALPRYQNLALTGGWFPVASGKSIHPGDQDPRIPAISKRLQTEGFLQTGTTDTLSYDEPLVQAVTQFQLRHGLTGDGVIGKTTITAMNIPAQKKVRQIIINLERWRRETHNLGKKYVMVNIAGFTLEGILDDKVILEMPVIVGTQQHETPLFSDLIQYIELNPYWNVPVSIARDEMLADLKKNPHYLSTNHIRLFSDRTSEAKEINPLSINWSQISPNKMSQFVLRQDPGKWNALGSIKFIFPNNFNVYMHDTPSQNYFKHSSRAFSHGCIRLGSPIKLADFLLNGADKNWPSERLNELIKTGKRTIIQLPTPLPVYITYQTVTSDQNGTVTFYTDIYNRDQQLEELLFKEEQKDIQTNKKYSYFNMELFNRSSDK
jgi:L,D-transpeptidase YcbB